ncbi:MAG: beta-lactamase family protein [Synergistaceae bacterium]|jgi:CubicO group peptidase (beta-lactamase class C family)|nr:beta-lactamase family protein [Synergistaceae bacterium]
MARAIKTSGISEFTSDFTKIEKFFNILFLTLTTFFFIVCGHGSLAAAAVSRNAPQRPTDAQREFASFVDGFFAGIQKERGAPGMAFSAVRDGEVLYVKGYGIADKESHIPVDPERTMFRVGFISQPVTAAAVMQLSERGRINLDEDVNVYLRRWKIPTTFENPITPRHLLTHTAGFDYKGLEVAAPTSADERNYASLLQKKMPARFAEPGTYYCTSNIGYSILGSIVERYSRVNFDAAVKKYIFQPLGMNGSVFAPNGEEMKNLASGYGVNGVKVPYEYRYDMPATGMSSTASDMARFMMASLSDGAIGRNRILGETHARSMLRRHFSPHPDIDGMGIGYLEKRVGGVRTLQQYGNIPGYSAFIMLIPEKNFGMFLAANTSGINFNGELAEAVVNRFFPVSADKKSPNALPSATVYPDIQGYYRLNDISRKTAEKVASIARDQISIFLEDTFVAVRHTKDKTPPTRWLPSEGSGDIFRRIGDDDFFTDEYMFFQRDELGAVSSVVIGGVDRTYDRLSTLESHYWQIVIISGFIGTALISFLGLFMGLTNNKGNFPWETGYTSDTELWVISSLFCAVQLSFVAGIIISIVTMGDEFRVFVPYQVKALFVTPLAGGLLLAWLWFRILVNLFNPDYHWFEKISIILIAFFETGYMFFLANWRLLGFMF